FEKGEFENETERAKGKAGGSTSQEDIPPSLFVGNGQLAVRRWNHVIPAHRTVMCFLASKVAIDAFVPFGIEPKSIKEKKADDEKRGSAVERTAICPETHRQ
ncbi:hypothetical protein FRC17_004948, partial [Serendipita sp. 399]